MDRKRWMCYTSIFFVSAPTRGINNMANKNTVTETDMRHALLDIEIEIDKKITEQIKTAKMEYNEAIAEFKIQRNDKIKLLRTSRKSALKDARNKMIAGEV